MDNFKLLVFHRRNEVLVTARRPFAVTVVPVVCVVLPIQRVTSEVCVLSLVRPMCEYFVENWVFGKGVLVISHGFCVPKFMRRN
jgi:hypothetical protein